MSNEQTPQSGGTPAGIREDLKSQKQDGAAGPYMSANLPELPAFIAKWRDEGESIVADGQSFPVVSTGSPGAADPITTEYFGHLSTAIGEIVQHNQVLSEYNGVYVENLSAGLSSMTYHEQATVMRYLEDVAGEVRGVRRWTGS